MIFAAPWVLIGLTALPVLWWLLRVTPPAPRAEDFPAIRLLLGLEATEETPARTPWWLLALRILIAALVIIGLARPVLDAGAALPGRGPVLLVFDNGWASASDWIRRKQAAETMLDRAYRAGRDAALLTTAPDGSATPIAISPVMPVPELRARLAAIQPQPWPPDRAAAARVLRAWQHPSGTSVIYVPDGLSDAPGFTRFANAMRAIGPVTELCCDMAAAPLLLPPRAEADALIARIAIVPRATPATIGVLAQAGDGRTLGRANLTIPPGASTGSARITLPPELRNRLTRLVLTGPPTAGGVALLDERWRRHPVGIQAGDLATADTPFTGPIYFLKRALEPYAAIRAGSIETLLKRQLSVLILADRPIEAGPLHDQLERWVRKGGLLIRFAGPRTADAAAKGTDTLLPVTLLAGDRQLGGAMSWSKPAGLAPFPPSSPFAGLPATPDVTVTRQVLAQPTAALAHRTWATLRDGTPLVTEAPLGAGRVVLFHVTANADWSNLPLSGLFVQMLRRLVDLSVGITVPPGRAILAPAETLDGFGLLGRPPAAAIGLRADRFTSTPVSPHHPPGLYGAENARQALNLGAAIAPPQAAPPIPGAILQTAQASGREQALGPPLLALAMLLLCADMLVSLALRGLLRPRRPGRSGIAAIVLLLMAFSTLPAPAAHALQSSPNPALHTRLGYILTGDAQVDAISRAGLASLSEYVDARTAATLYEPDPIRIGVTDLSFYPLLYWPITAGAPALTPAQAAQLNTYMARGGIIVIDTRNAGSGAGFHPGTRAALRRIAHALIIPALAPLTSQDVLAHTFYLLSEFPGRFTGGTVWVQRGQDPTNDSVSPVIIGGNDWAAAWARNPDGSYTYATIPGGEHQRTYAYRFGVNLVMYALTGNYKGDQVHIPAILQRLGE